MNEFKGTPGPWVANPIYGWIESDIEDKVVIGGNQPPTREDVRLIAAAPELLDALQLAEKVMVGRGNLTYDEWRGAVDKARSAITKALGESK